MPMPTYIVYCYTPHCGKPAQYKIAARWSDGITSELKTYSLTCRECLKEAFLSARQRREACSVAAGETLDHPAIFYAERGMRDQQLVRQTQLESQFLATDP